METATERITARRFMELEDRGEFRDRFVQLVDGELIVTEPLPLHGVLQIRLGTEL
jgi:hypothetical protein